MVEWFEGRVPASVCLHEVVGRVEVAFVKFRFDWGAGTVSQLLWRRLGGKARGWSLWRRHVSGPGGLFLVLCFGGGLVQGKAVGALALIGGGFWGLKVELFVHVEAFPAVSVVPDVEPGFVSVAVLSVATPPDFVVDVILADVVA